MNNLDMIKNTPTADVVPKSEYDKAILLLEEEIARLKNSILPSYYQACSEDEAIKIGIEYGKQEAKEEIDRLKKYNTDVAFKHYFDGRKDVASEIFAEIENNLSQITRQSSVTRMIAELKKKYTEGEDKPAASEEKYFTPEDVRKMTPQEVREKYTAIRRSMKRW